MPRYAELDLQRLLVEPRARDAPGADRSQPGSTSTARCGSSSTRATSTSSAAKSDDSLFDEKIATFEEDDGAYDQADAEGFIKLNALRLRNARPASEADGRARSTLWHGRFAGGPSEALQALNDSLPFDRGMYREDIAGSRAHVSMLGVGRPPHRRRDATQILAALDPVEAEIADGTFVFVASDEDIHTAVERRVTELAGAVPAPSSTPADSATTRSPPIYGCGPRPRIDRRGRRRVLGLQRTLLARPKRPATPTCPGYTHLQQAQPVAPGPPSAGPRLGAGTRRRSAARRPPPDRRLDRSAPVRSPGSVAAARPGPDRRAARLRRRVRQQLDAVSDRDFVAELALSPWPCSACTSVGIGEELILWAIDRVRLRRPRRRILDRLVDDAAEEEPRHRRAGPRQGRSAHRPPDRPADHPQGPAAHLQQGSPGGQGAALRRRRHRVA